MSSLATAEVTSSGLRYVIPDNYPGISATRYERTPSTLLLSQEEPSTQPMYFRMGHGRVEWGDDLAAFLAGNSQVRVSPGTLLGLIHGIPLPPDTTHLPGVRRLALGTEVRMDHRGVTAVSQSVAAPVRRANLAEVITEVLTAGPTEYAIAYSGGMSSTFLAASARAAGHRPLLVHAELHLPSPDGFLPQIDGLTVERVPVDLVDAMSINHVTGNETMPPMPEAYARRHIAARLGEASGRPMVSGGLLADLVSVKLPEINTGPWGWRLLGCEPFHVTGAVRNLRQARKLVRDGTVQAPGQAVAPQGEDEPDSQPGDTSGAQSRLERGLLPGLTKFAQRALRSTRQGSLAMWREHLLGLDPVYARLVGAIEGSGISQAHDAGEVTLPALATSVVAAAAALPARQVGRIRGGVFINHLPLRQVIDAHPITGIRASSLAFQLRFGAAAYLRRDRVELSAELSQKCALADMGLIEPKVIIALLNNGLELTNHALPLLRLVWLDRWLRGRP